MTVRRYRGFCTDRDVLGDALASIRERRDAILGLVDALPDPDGRVAKPARRYLEAFFGKADRPDRLLKRFERRCL